LVIQLRGEMGNHLSAIAHGMGFAWYASRVHGITLQPKLRHQVVRTVGNDQQPDTESSKWKPTRDVIQQCFPKLRSWDFDRGSTWMEYYDSERRQREWLPPVTRSKLDYVDGRLWLGRSTRIDRMPVEFRDWNTTLQTLHQLWQSQDRPMSRVFSSSPTHHQAGTAKMDAAVSIPFIRSESLENTLVVDLFLDELRDLFEFDYASCCGTEAPQDDETVLHYRNFATELSIGSDSALEDVSPSQTVNVLLEHLRPGDKVSITTRTFNEHLQLHLDAMQARGLQVRVIQGQSGMQDFCFLLKAKKELIGNFQSTFFFWACVLGRAKIARLYTIDSPQRRERCGNSTSIMKRRFLYPWTHPDLKDRLRHLLIPFHEDGPTVSGR